jgi:hypothetical protein
MKKSIAHADGTQEVLEGTPEEIAKYEQLMPRLQTVVVPPAAPEPKRIGPGWEELMRDLERVQQITDRGRKCVAEEFFQKNPDTQIAGISCTCGRCRATFGRDI